MPQVSDKQRGRKKWPAGQRVMAPSGWPRRGTMDWQFGEASALQTWSCVRRFRFIWLWMPLLRAPCQHNFTRGAVQSDRLYEPRSSLINVESLK